LIDRINSEKRLPEVLLREFIATSGRFLLRLDELVFLALNNIEGDLMLVM
jgi:hypothetical protein